MPNVALTLIAAVANNLVIGLGNDLPWHLPSDLKHFKAQTSGHRIVMGRNTWESIGSKPLPNRTNIVISSRGLDANDSVISLASIPALMKYLEEVDDDRETFIIGGQMIYEQTICFADRLLITHIKHDFDGDRFFPDIDASIWQTISEKQVLDDNYPYSIVDYRRIIT